MGAKDHRNMESDRPESGGADKEMQREKSGLADRDKELFAQSEAEKAQGDIPRKNVQGTDEFSVGSPRNPEP